MIEIWMENHLVSDNKLLPLYIVEYCNIVKSIMPQFFDKE
jgi:hypothetical protein